MLVRLLYASRSAGGNTNDLVHAIMAESRNYNQQHGITGILCYGSDVFMQVLEGGRAIVNDLYARILHDKRHNDVVILHYEEIVERRFSGWTMGQVNLCKLNPSVLLKYSETPELNPHAVSGQVAMALIEELMATASIIGRT